MSSAPSPKPRRAAKPATRKPRGPDLQLQVEPQAPPEPLTWRTLLRKITFSVSLGAAISVGLHIVVGVILTWIVIRLPDRGHGSDSIFTTWLDSSSLPPGPPKRKPVSLPLTITPPTEDAPPGKAAPAGKSAETPPPSATVSVRPVGVGGALENRGLIGGGGGGGGGGAGGGAAAFERLGGSSGAQRAIKAGLGWLARQQGKDGRWELHQGYPDASYSATRTDTGATALALLALLGAGHADRTSEHGKAVQAGLKWLVGVQDPATGDLHDLRQEEGRQPAFYAHSMATIALCEALALTGDESLRPPVQRAVNYLLRSQHPETGGWKYRPISRAMVGDLSVTGWALMALHSARMAGIEVPQEEFERASAFLDSVQEQGGARYKYEPLDPPHRVTAALTAEGLLCRQWMGWPRNHPPQQDAIAYLLSEANQPQWAPGRRNVYGWYYTAQALHNVGGDAWEQWYPPVRDLVVRSQAASGSVKAPNDVRGSWHPTQPPGTGEEYGDKAGRLYVTVMCLLILETPFRHKPLYEPP